MGDFLVKRSRSGKIGTKGLEQFGGRISEEWLLRLRDKRGERVFQEMSDNDDAVGAILFLIEMLLRNVVWRVEAFSDDPLHQDQAEYVESLMDDMAITWEDFIAEVQSMLIYGYAPFEICYKRRVGPFEKDPNKKSLHTDGLIGWGELAIRAQTTIERWEFDDNGVIIGLHQLDPFATGTSGSTKDQGREVFIPEQKLLLFRTTSRRGNPEGRSVLRNAFVSWFYKKRIQESEAIGIERDLAGMPIIFVPAEMFADDASDEMKAQLSAYRDLIENIKRDEQSGIIMPSLYDANGNKEVTFELASTGASRVIDTDKIIKRYDVGIARTVLADFLMLGHQGTGSFALSDDKTTLFSNAIGAWMKMIASELNRKGLTRIYELNGWNPSEVALLAPGDIEKEDVERFSNAVTTLTGAGWLTPGSEEDENHFRGLLNMPQKVEDEAAPAKPDTDNTDAENDV